MEAVPDAASFAAIRVLEALLGRRVGPSTGTNFVACARILAEMKAEGRAGSVVTLLCDGGERYADTAYDDRWLATQGVDVEPWLEPLRVFAAEGVLAAAAS